MRKVIAFFLLITLSACTQNKLPSGFVYLGEEVPSIQVELRYFTNNNFIGTPIDGYNKNVVIVTKETADALEEAQKRFKKEYNVGLKIYDAYRPQQAVNHFVRWAKVEEDTLMKAQYYPNVSKSELFKRGFIASKSGHSRGSTVDVTLVDLDTGKELDMGSSYDFFGTESHPFYRKVTKKQKENRMLLRRIMLIKGFKPYDNEWWHFTLKDEPFPKTYFNFPVE